MGIGWIELATGVSRRLLRAFFLANGRKYYEGICVRRASWLGS
jgi:hypothetical protein